MLSERRVRPGLTAKSLPLPARRTLDYSNTLRSADSSNVVTSIVLCRPRHETSSSERSCAAIGNEPMYELFSVRRSMSASACARDSTTVFPFRIRTVSSESLPEVKPRC
jgi:hypothetical protein